MTPAQAGLRYALYVFALGFLLGTLRILVLAPRLGPDLAVLAELPLMLAAAWWLSGRALRQIPVAPGVPRLHMGAVYLALLLGLEALLAAAMGTPPARFLAGLATPVGAAGLAAQALTALYPRLQRP